VGLQNALRQQVMASTSGEGVFKRLSDIGIDMQRGGKLVITGSKLDTALKTPDALKAMFATNVATGSDSNGLGVKLKAFTGSLLSFDGMMNSKADALSAAVKRNTAEQDKVNDRAAVVEKRLRAQYTALDTKMGSLSALNSYISQQVSQWNKS
jgi:flagellar hook-associated protein 2